MRPNYALSYRRSWTMPKKHQPNQVLALFGLQVKMCNDCLDGCIQSKPAKQNLRYE